MTAVEGTINSSAVWLAAAFAIAAAIFAEQAFRVSNRAVPPEPWRGDSGFHFDLHHNEEIKERAGRDSMRSRAAALQSVATFLGASAAVEAASATQTGVVGVGVALIGLSIGLILPIFRWIQSSREIEQTNAWYARIAWDMRRKHVTTHDPAQEDADFAKEYPHHAAALRRRKP